jgi:hypothetical protein
MEAHSESSPDPAAPEPAQAPEPVDSGSADGDGKGGEEKSRTEQIRVIGGLVALGSGLVALSLVLILAIVSNVDGDQFTQLATTVVGVIGSVVGAYFGVKIGTDGTQKALEGQRQEAARSQIFAAHLPPDLAEKALDLAFPQGEPSAPSAQSSPESSPESSGGQGRIPPGHSVI